MTRSSTAVVTVMALCAALALAAAPVGAQTTPTCDGVAATIVGTEGNDVLLGTDGPDVMVGLGGNDVMRGFGGNDLMCGDNGRDRMFGGLGNDVMFGGLKNDIVKGDQGRDFLFGNQGNDRVIGGGSIDDLNGGSGLRDRLDGKAGFDTCTDPQSTTRLASCEDVFVPRLDLSRAAAFGDLELAPGFTPDPNETQATSGGNINVSYLGDGCVGFASSAPDLQLTYGPGGSYLRVYFEADTAGDTTLIINDPSGNWLCNDDFTGFDPAIELTNPAAGTYDIWIGSLGSPEGVAGTIGITELPPPSLDFSLPANFGDVELSPGFTPDPNETRATSGGPVNVSNLGEEGCFGFASSAPDLQLTYGPGGSYLRVYFEADTIGDTTLIINDPSGNWLCNDDFNGLDPAIELTNPDAGIYDIWIGSLAPAEAVEGTVGITELP